MESKEYNNYMITFIKNKAICYGCMLIDLFYGDDRIYVIDIMSSMVNKSIGCNVYLTNIIDIVENINKTSSIIEYFIYCLWISISSDYIGECKEYFFKIQNLWSEISESHHIG